MAEPPTPSADGVGQGAPPGTGAVAEAGTITGNVYDKYGTRNPIARWLMDGFLGAARDLASLAGVEDLHEVGCGEGHLAVQLAQWGYRVRGTDVGPTIIERARAHAAAAGVDVSTAASHDGAANAAARGPRGGVTGFEIASIYELDPLSDAAPLVVCCEVLEHLDEPERALSALRAVARPWLLVSVPREPIWRVANMARGRYLSALGNTPGHLNHWSKRSFLRLLTRHSEVVAVRSPFPWTMALCRVESDPDGVSRSATARAEANDTVGSTVGTA